MPAKSSNTVYIVKATFGSVLLTFGITSLVILLGDQEVLKDFLEFAATVVVCLGAAGGVSAPAKKLGDAWQAGRDSNRSAELR